MGCWWIGRGSDVYNALIKITFEIAYLKEALRTWKGVKSPEAVFFAAYKERRKPESA